MKIKISDYPELRLIAWNRNPNDWIEGAEALALYEANWRYVDFERMSSKEKYFLNQLVNEYGNGVLHV